MRQIHRGTTLLTATLVALLGAAAVAQPVGGLVNEAVGPLGVFRGDGPGWFYYGINGADRGLGYIGSYMTLGGFIPYAEDDLGGLWAADVRSHLSVNGGFFSNVGAVRKQFIGGTLLGVGVYWDYDGDLNQDPIWGVPGTEVYGQFGHVYNQVGVSGEWLTDYGNLRSNGYIPVGTTAYTRGAPGFNFADSYLLCQNGLDAALGGADLEVGVYVPALADWAGMISVGGYAYGNARYEWEEGSELGEAVVPWFGGVYTRLDMTLANNWDFSLRANNDSFFDWTGYARLTYRMGGSRRRNVPDQVEQPMMRNEHVVRAHETPIVAINPATNQPWNVIHVDNSAPVGGNGTATAPVRTLALAQTRATQPYDIVYVRTGTSGTVPYESNWQFQADNQFLVGQGSTLAIDTLSCGPRTFFAQPAGARPVLTSGGTAITLRNGAIVDHFLIEDAPVGILADASLVGTAYANDVVMAGNALAGDLGVAAVNVPAGSQVNLYNMQLANMDRGLLVDGGAGDVVFQGLIENTASPGPSLQITNTTGGTVQVNETIDTLQTPVASNGSIVAPLGIIDTQSTAAAPLVVDNTTDTTIGISQALLVEPANDGLLVENNANSTISVTGLEVDSPGGSAVVVRGNTGGTIDLVSLDVAGPAAAGLVVENNIAAAVSFDTAVVANAAAEGVFVDGNAATTVSFTDLLVEEADRQALLTQGNDAASLVEITGASSLSSGSTTLPAFESNDDATFDIELLSLESAVTPGTNAAIVLQGTSLGAFTISDSFRVSGTPGTEAGDVTNGTGVIFSLPAP
jgi:hypothetical protein